jgi:pyroglutamyl-peptidase
MARPRVLITGFGPFPGVKENPSAWLAEALAEHGPPEFDAELHARVLPTEWRAAELMPGLYASLQPHVMIHFGVDRRAKALRIERFAHNRTARRADAAGALPASAMIAPEGPDRYATELPAAALAAHLRNCGLPAVTSRSAGNYLCNFLYYHSLSWARQQGDACLALFMHIPPPNSPGPFSDETLLVGARETLRFLLTVAREQNLNAALTGTSSARNEFVLSAKEA